MPQPINETAIQNVLSRFQDPETGRSVVQLEQIHDLDLQDGRLSVTSSSRLIASFHSHVVHMLLLLAGISNSSRSGLAVPCESSNPFRSRSRQPLGRVP